jgi:hypothetical protein
LIKRALFGWRIRSFTGGDRAASREDRFKDHGQACTGPKADSAGLLGRPIKSGTRGLAIRDISAPGRAVLAAICRLSKSRHAFSSAAIWDLNDFNDARRRLWPIRESCASRGEGVSIRTLPFNHSAASVRLIWFPKREGWGGFRS